jgi:nucleoside-triphosphatase THEP1
MASGKTSLCKLLFHAMEDSNLKPFAIIQENRRDAKGYPVALRLIELPGGKECFLGARAGNVEELYSGEGSGKELKPFVFERSAFAWATTEIAQALAKDCGALIIDEIGPLEVLEGGGLMTALEAAAKAERVPLIVSLRPSLEEKLMLRLSRFPSRQILRIATDCSKGKNDLFPLIQTIIRHCQDKK